MSPSDQSNTPMTEPEQSNSMEIGWAILELMGHRKLAGHVTDETGLVRIDVYDSEPTSCVVCQGRGGWREGDEDVCCPDCDGDGRTTPRAVATQWYGRQAIYCITASTRSMCVQIAQSHKPAPVGRWELPERTVETADGCPVARQLRVVDEEDWRS